MGQGYDLVLSGTVGDAPIDVDALAGRLGRAEYAPVVQSLNQIGFPSIESFLGTFAGRGPELKPWVAGADLNRDRNLRLQDLAVSGSTVTIRISFTRRSSAIAGGRKASSPEIRSGWPRSWPR